MKFICPITTLKFVGTISLGLLTGVSYNLNTITLPSLALLPSANLASTTLTTIQTTSTRQILTLASISSLALITSYTLASPRGKHPYLLWTALVSFIGGQGVEYWYNGLDRFYLLGGGGAGLSSSSASSRKNKSMAGSGTLLRESGFVEVEGVEGSTAGGEVNGEKVEMEMTRERRTQLVRTVVSGVGFAMGVIGVWGDGA